MKMKKIFGSLTFFVAVILGIRWVVRLCDKRKTKEYIKCNDE